MPSVNVHGPEGMGGGGGNSSMNGVSRGLGDAWVDMLNKGAQPGDLASFKTLLKGRAPELAQELFGGRGRRGGGSGPGGSGGGSSGPSNVNVTFKIADIGLSKVDSTLQKILEAVKSGNTDNKAAATGAAFVPASQRSPAAPTARAAAAKGQLDWSAFNPEAVPFRDQQRAFRGIDRQRASIQRAQIAQENSAARAQITQDRVYGRADAAQQKAYRASANQTFIQRPPGSGLIPSFGGGGGGLSGGGGSLSPSAGGGGNGAGNGGGWNGTGFFPDWNIGGRSYGWGGGGGPVPGYSTITRGIPMPMPNNGIGARMRYGMANAWANRPTGAQIMKMGGTLIADATMAYAAGIPYANYQNGLTGMRIRAGIQNQTIANPMGGTMAVSPLEGAFGVAGGVTPAWMRHLGITPFHAEEIAQNAPFLPSTADGIKGLVAAIGATKFMPGLAGLPAGMAEQVAPNMFNLFGGNPKNAGVQAMQYQMQMGSILGQGNSQGISSQILSQSLYGASNTLAGLSQGQMSFSAVANDVTPYFNSGMTPTQAAAASQTGIQGFYQGNSEALSDPYRTFTYASALMQAQSKGLASVIGKDNYSYLQNSKIGKPLLDAYNYDMKHFGPQQPQTIRDLQNIASMSGANYGEIEDNLGTIGEKAFGLNGQGPGVDLAFRSRIADQNTPDYIASRMKGMGDNTFTGSISDSLTYGAQYLAYQKSIHGNDLSAIAGGYNGGGTKGYAQQWMKGYKPGDSNDNLVYNALGTKYTKAQLAQFTADIPAIREAAKNANIPASWVARTMGQESSGGTSKKDGNNVMNVLAPAIQQDNMTYGPANISANEQDAAAYNPIGQGAGLGVSGGAYDIVTAGTDGIGDAVGVVTKAASDIGKGLDLLKTHIDAINQRMKKLGF